MSHVALPALIPQEGLTSYLDMVYSHPSLEAEDEYMLAKRLKEHKDVQAAQQLVTSHLKLVARIALGFRGYGLPVMDLISEGNIGLMHAVRKFNPDLGYRLSTYAMWWIRASIQEYIIRSWSLVKMGTTSAQKKLFFSLNKIKNRIRHLEAREMNDGDHAMIAEELGVTTRDVEEMNVRMAGDDLSLDMPVSNEIDTCKIDYIPESAANQEMLVMAHEEHDFKKKLLMEALSSLNEREQDIIASRKLQEPAITLQELSSKYNVSCERIRQIEERAMQKLQEKVAEHTGL